MAKSDGWRMRDVREVIDQIEMEGVDRGARRCGIHTGDKGPNTHWVHGENIEITVNI